MQEVSSSRSRAAADAARRVRFLRVANRGWLGMGLLGVASWPFYPTETLFFAILLGGSAITFLLVAELLRRGRPRPAAYLFCILGNLTIFGMMVLNYLIHGFGDLEANLTRVSALAVMGLSIVFAGATIGPNAAFGFAAWNIVLLASSVLFLDVRLGPKVSVPVFWSFLAVSVWLYERQVKEALDGLQAAHDSLERKVEDRTLELRQAKEDVEAANRELEAFSYSVAHDLRAPLRRIDGFASILEEEAGAGLGSGADSALKLIRRQSRRMSRLIEDLLALSRVGRAPLRRTSLDLSALSREIAEDLAAREPGRRIEWVIAPELRAHADPGLVRALLENLLGNAWKFTSKTDRASIEVGRSEAGAFFVRDNGAGFDMAHAEKLFLPFERLHAEEEFAGSGIGLTIVRRVVQRHGGSVRAEGDPGRGAVFLFTLG